MTQPLNLVDLAATRAARAAAAARPRLLLVDDEPTVGRMMGHAAEECGYDAAVSISASSFRNQYEADPPDLVLLDLSLPGGDGIELLRFLARKRSEALIFIVSGFDKRVVEAARRLGEALGLRMGDCLTKPVRIDELGEAIERARRQHSGEGGTDDSGVCFAS